MKDSVFQVASFEPLLDQLTSRDGTNGVHEVALTDGVEGARALRTAWALKSLKGILGELSTSRNIVGQITVAWYGLALNVIKHGIDTRGIYYAVTGATFSLFAAVGTGVAACG